MLKEYYFVFLIFLRLIKYYFNGFSLFKYSWCCFLAFSWHLLVSVSNNLFVFFSCWTLVLSLIFLVIMKDFPSFVQADNFTFNFIPLSLFLYSCQKNIFHFYGLSNQSVQRECFFALWDITMKKMFLVINVLVYEWTEFCVINISHNKCLNTFRFLVNLKLIQVNFHMSIQNNGSW